MSTITIALPSKGRIKEETAEVIEGMEGVEIAYLSASEIARELASGAVDFGVTGEDLVREGMAGADARVEFCARLGFGHADVVVAVPEIWLDVETMADLGDVAADFRARHGRRLAIATKYWRLTQQFFSSQHGFQLYRIVESLGATEGAPAAGQADIIVDITSTGSTLRANHLKILSDGVILKSEACLVRARKPAHEQDSRIARIVEAVRAAL
jgi:ATP phosphoribosyltransferase